MFVGLLLVILGALMLLDRMGYLYGDVWDYFLPLALVALGVSMIMKNRGIKKP